MRGIPNLLLMASDGSAARNVSSVIFHRKQNNKINCPHSPKREFVSALEEERRK